MQLITRTKKYWGRPICLCPSNLEGEREIHWAFLSGIYQWTRPLAIRGPCYMSTATMLPLYFLYLYAQFKTGNNKREGWHIYIWFRYPALFCLANYFKTLRSSLSPTYRHLISALTRASPQAVLWMKYNKSAGFKKWYAILICKTQSLRKGKMSGCKKEWRKQALGWGEGATWGKEEEEGVEEEGERENRISFIKFCFKNHNETRGALIKKKKS